jgi:adenylate cyclase
MKYQTKLFLVLIGLTLITNGLLITIYYHDSSKHLRRQMDAKALSIAEAAAATIDGDELEQLNNTRDMNSPLYKKYEMMLRKIRNANRRSDTYVKYIFTMMPDTKNPGHILFGVDAEEAGPDKSILGERYVFQAREPYLLEDHAVQKHFTVDQWGEWLEAHAPIYDSKGKLVGALGVDINVNRVTERLNHLLYMGYLALGLSLLLAIILAYFLARRATRPLGVITDALNTIGRGNLDVKVNVKTKDEFASVGNAINNMVLGLRQRDNLKMSLARYVSNQVAEKIIETGKLPEVQGERRKITVLFCDVRNFTTLAENLAPEEVVGLLNEAFEVMIDAIFKYQGMLDKFLGDGFMAIFGAPLDDNIQEEHAINAALAMQCALLTLAEKWQQERGINFRMGIGINTGIAIVGNIGSKQRMEYTAIGDTVNLAARLESATKELGTRILISENTYQAVTNKFSCKSLGSIHVKGRNEPVQVYEVEDNVIK